MGETTKYFVVKQKAIPEVLLKVVEAKRLLESEKVLTIQEAVDAVGISRSSFYKYKDDIFPFHDNSQGTTITLTFQMDDEPGDIVGCAEDHRRVPGQYPDDPSEYSHQRNRFSDIEYSGIADHGGHFPDDRAAGGTAQCTSCKNTGKRIKFFTRKFVPAQGTKVPESLQAMRKARVMI